MKVFLQVLAVFSAFCLMAFPAQAEDNSGFGVSLFDNRPPPALEDIPLDGGTVLNGIAPAAGAQAPLPADPADSAAAGSNADFTGNDEPAPAQPAAEDKDKRDIAWP